MTTLAVTTLAQSSRTSRPFAPKPRAGGTSAPVPTPPRDPTSAAAGAPRGRSAVHQRPEHQRPEHQRLVRAIRSCMPMPLDHCLDASLPGACWSRVQCPVAQGSEPLWDVVHPQGIGVQYHNNPNRSDSRGSVGGSLFRSSSRLHYCAISDPLIIHCSSPAHQHLLTCFLFSSAL